MAKKVEENTATRRTFPRRMVDSITYDLRERVKELNCLYAISSMVERHGISLEEILQGTVDIIPLAWQYPEITSSRIVLGDRTFKTRNFRETPWHQSQPVFMGGAAAGFLQICYLEERPEKDEGPFLKEERSLIKVIAERVGSIIERKKAETALKESEARNRALLRAIPDLMFQLDREGTLIGFHEGKFAVHRAFFSDLLGKNLYALVREERLLPKRLLEQGMMYVRRAFATGKAQIFEQHLSLNDFTGDFEIRIVVAGPNQVLGIVRDITIRKRLEREILEISGREQRRIGQDLHDSLCQHLAGVGFMAKVIERQVSGGTPIDQTHVKEMIQLIDDAITLTRGFARGLNPVTLEAEGLKLALTELAANTRRFFGITCEFLYDEPFLVEDDATASHLYRIVQEAINNAIKHGKAKAVTIAFRKDGKTNTLSVTDDGIGITGVHHPGKGMGLSIMNYRASMIGATIDVRPGEGKGTAVICSFPGKITRG